jgi:hypothetical protein
MAEVQKMPAQSFPCLLLGFKRDMNQATEHLEQLKARMKKMSLAYPAYTSIQSLAFLFEEMLQHTFWIP